MTDKEVIVSLAESCGSKIVVAKKKKRGGYTIYPQVTEVVHTTIPMIGDCKVIVFEES